MWKKPACLEMQNKPLWIPKNELQWAQEDLGCCVKAKDGQIEELPNPRDQKTHTWTLPWCEFGGHGEFPDVLGKWKPKESCGLNPGRPLEATEA